MPSTATGQRTSRRAFVARLLDATPEALVIAGLIGSTLITHVALPVPMELVALIVTLLMPVTAGVPLIKPVDVFTLSPAGKPTAL